MLARDRRALAVARQLQVFARTSRQGQAWQQQPGDSTRAPTRRSTQSQTARDNSAAALNARQRRSKARAEAYVAKKRAAELPPPRPTATPPARDAQVQVVAPPAPARDAQVQVSMPQASCPTVPRTNVGKMAP